MRPDDALHNAFIYCLARAVDKDGMEVHGFCVMSNHYHLVLTDPQGLLPDFMAWLNRQLAMCVKRLRSWDEVVWEPNVQYSAVEFRGHGLSYPHLIGREAAQCDSPGAIPNT